MRVFTIYITITFASLLCGCRDVKLPYEDQKILFLYNYRNISSVNDNEGIIIDGQGNILIFKQPEKWNLPDSNSLLSSSQVAENLAQCKSTGLRVPDAELSKYAGYIDNLASSRVSAKKSISAGHGTYSYYCYGFDPGRNIYRQVTIKTYGDTDCENLNFYTRKTVEWINLLKKDLPVRHL